jgi:hypothetical protein
VKKSPSSISTEDKSPDVSKAEEHVAKYLLMASICFLPREMTGLKEPMNGLNPSDPKSRLANLPDQRWMK